MEMDTEFGTRSVHDCRRISQTTTVEHVFFGLSVLEPIEDIGTASAMRLPLQAVKSRATEHCANAVALLSVTPDEQSG